MEDRRKSPEQIGQRLLGLHTVSQTSLLLLLHHFPPHPSNSLFDKLVLGCEGWCCDAPERAGFVFCFVNELEVNGVKEEPGKNAEFSPIRPGTTAKAVAEGRGAVTPTAFRAD